MKPLYFDSPAAFRRWLAENHESADELWVGFHKKATGRPTLTWPESVDEALCFGWIDGIRKTVDGERYVIRFTPRRSGSHWSLINTKRVPELVKAGLMQPAGLKAFKARDPRKTGLASYEQQSVARLSREAEARFKANRAAWKFFSAQPPGYRKIAIRWIVSAKKEETRDRRLGILIKDSAAGRRIGLLNRSEVRVRSETG